MKKCRFCAEEIQDEAIVCKHCGRDLVRPLGRRHVRSRGYGLVFFVVVVGLIGISISISRMPKSLSVSSTNAASTIPYTPLPDKITPRKLDCGVSLPHGYSATFSAEAKYTPPMVDLTIRGEKPNATDAEHALRACVTAAVQHEKPAIDLLAQAWYSKSGRQADDDTVDLVDGSPHLVYAAKRSSILTWKDYEKNPNDHTSRQKPAQGAEAQVAKIDRSSKMQEQRKAFLQKLIDRGVFKSVECRNLGAAVLVNPAFYALDFKAKDNSASVVYALCFDGTHELDAVTIMDARTLNVIGSYSSLNPGLQLK